MWIKCLAQGHNSWCLWGLNPLPRDLKFDALPLHHSHNFFSKILLFKGSYREAMTPLSPENNVPPNSHSRGKPPRPDPPKVQDNTESTSDSVFKSPVRRTNSRSRTTSETPVLANSSTSSTKQRGSSRRGKKRSPVDGDDDLVCFIWMFSSMINIS